MPHLDNYSNRSYWRGRFDNFSILAPLFEEIWCVSEVQVEEYKRVFGAQKVRLLPIIPWGDEGHYPMQDGDRAYDIDALFTGTMTFYRKQVLDRLRQVAFKVVAAPMETPSFIRYDLTARTKVALHIKQFPFWPHPSAMRLHKLLMLGKAILSETAQHHCLQENFVISFDGTPEIPLRELVSHRDFKGLGYSLRQRYFKATREIREEFRSQLQALFLGKAEH